MKELISKLKSFEGRNNISANVIVSSDGSFGVHEFWSEESLGSFDSTDDLLKFLEETQYALDEKGMCIKPCKIV